MKEEIVQCHWCGKSTLAVYELWEWWACKECFMECFEKESQARADTMEVLTWPDTLKVLD